MSQETNPKNQEPNSKVPTGLELGSWNLEASLREFGISDLSLGRILESYMEELENGREPNPEELVARHPELAEALRGCLASLDFLNQAGNRGQETRVWDSKSGNASSLTPDPGLLAPDSGRLGDFRLIREVGRGGMGVVHEAEQISLARRVALKVLPFAAALDVKQLQRFKNEALAAAGLRHPNIVPIHAVGEERGVHYYAMQLIDGQSLAEVIARLREEKSRKNPKHEEANPKIPTSLEVRSPHLESPSLGATVVDVGPNDSTCPNDRRSSILHPQSSILYRSSSFFRTAAELGIQAAEALEHAHRLGIIHRDIKPANLILDNEGKLWVTDFGLALIQNNVELTATGAMLGTLRYMSPEQAAAERGLIDQRADIYSLGATLYELLTLRPAFGEQDRHQLLAQIATQEPCLPRRLNPSIPKDLETIVLKAMAKAPEDRYSTAEQLAEDLRRFLDTRPGLHVRAGKWCKRHKAFVVSTGMLLAGVLIMVAILFYEGQERAKDAYQAKVREQIQLRQEQDRLIATLNIAKEALDELSLKPALNRLVKNPNPKVQQENRELLQRVLSYYRRLADMNSTVAEARYVSALAYRQVGEIFEALGDLTKGQESYEKAINALEGLVADDPQNPQFGSELVESQLALGRLLWSNGQPDQAEQTLRQEIDALRQTIAKFPNDSRFGNYLARCRLDLSQLLMFKGNYQQAEELLGQNQRILKELPADFPCQQVCFQKTLADNHTRLGWVYMNTGRGQSARRVYALAVEILEKLISVCPDPNYQSDLINVYLNQATLLRNGGQFQEAERTHERGIALAKKLVADHPLVPDSEFDLAQQQHELGVTLARMGRGTEAEPLYKQSIDSLDQLTKVLPRKQSYKKELALCRIDFGLLYESAHKEQEAEEALAKAADMLQELVQSFPSVLEFQADLGSCLYHQARLLTGKGDREKACDLLKKAIGFQRSTAQKNPSNPELSRFLCLEYWLLAKLLIEEGKADRAHSLLQEVTQSCTDLPGLLNDLAWFMVRESRAPVGDFSLALQMAKQAVSQNSDNGNFWNTQGVAHYRMGQWQDAISALTHARTLHKDQDCTDFFFLAMAHWQAGDKATARQWYQKAEAVIPKNGLNNQEIRSSQEEAAKLLGIPPFWPI
jgi:eukaryotic-like serine/threonine-protein kinase